MQQINVFIEGIKNQFIDWACAERLDQYKIEIISLESKVEVLNIISLNRLKQINTLEGEVNSLKSSNSSLQTQNNVLTATNSSLNNEINELNITILDLTSPELDLPEALKQQFSEHEDVTGYIHVDRRPFNTKKGKRRSFIDARQLYSIGSSRAIQLCQMIYDEYKPNDVADMKLAVCKWQSKMVKYVTDLNKFGFTDFREYLEEVFLMNYLEDEKDWISDCESKAFATAGLMMNFRFIDPKFKIEWWEISAELGFIHSNGHGWNKIWDRRDGCYRIYEATNPLVINNSIHTFLKAEGNTSYDPSYGVYRDKIYVYESMVFGSPAGELKSVKDDDTKGLKIIDETRRMIDFVKHKKVK